MDFEFFNVESIGGFTSTYLDLCYAISYPFGFMTRIKHPPLYIIKFLVATLINQDKKFSFIRVDVYGALVRSSIFLKTCHNMNIIVKLQVEIHIYSMVILKVLIRHLLITQELFY